MLATLCFAVGADRSLTRILTLICTLNLTVKRGDVVVETFQEKIEKQIFVGGLPEVDLID